ncbi:hypothetical protein KRX57_01960 [Weeksellaceae bacterium TAE3-ERU29]|nr:hypothetical protein [Weeksellaceae bacterium TAE3-ERU29]
MNALKKSVYRGLLPLLLLVMVGKVSAQNKSDFKTIRERIAKMIIAQTSDETLQKEVPELLKTEQCNGMWNAVDYHDKSMVDWKPIYHLYNVETLAIAFTKKGTKYYNDNSLYESINKGLNYWCEVQPTSNNWWHNDINAPKLLGRILVVMSVAPKPLDLSLKNKMIALMEKAPSPKEKTGANKLDIAIHNIYRASVTDDDKLMKFATEEAFQPLQFTEEEGIQYDNSYQQHGAQLHIASYGQVFLSGEYMVASWLVGTNYALSKEKTDILNDYFFNTYVPAIRGRYADFNIVGRRISRPNALDKKSLNEIGFEEGFLPFAEVVVDKSQKKDFENFVARTLEEKPSDFGVKPQHIYFWKGDYTLHQRPGYSFNVRTNSTRTKRTERGNDENLFADVLADGATNIQVKGDEYFNIMPVWEWDKIPGVTSRDYVEYEAVPKEKEWGIDGTTTFVGGVSDGLYGATVYTQNYDSITAKKGYFFFDNAVVCLGTDINSQADEPIVTTINQTLSKGNIYALQNGKINEITTNGKISADAIWHNNVAYIFPQKTDLSLTNEIQKGSWGRINTAHTDLPDVEEKVFKLWINQGVKPVNASYEYMVYPNSTKENLAVNFNNKDIQILRNDAKIQAVQNKKLNIVQIIFYESGSLKWDNQEIKVDKPCILQVRKLSRRNTEISVADPNQTEEEINVVYTSSRKSKNLKFDLPKGVYKGKTIQKRIRI